MARGFVLTIPAVDVTITSPRVLDNKDSLLGLKTFFVAASDAGAEAPTSQPDLPAPTCQFPYAAFWEKHLEKFISQAASPGGTV